MAEISRKAMRRATNPRVPGLALAAIQELRGTLDELEMEAIETARRQGATWEDVAELLGISRQALHARLAQDR